MKKNSSGNFKQKNHCITDIEKVEIKQQSIEEILKKDNHSLLSDNFIVKDASFIHPNSNLILDLINYDKKNIKCVTTQFDKKFSYIDTSITAKGRDEEEVYLFNFTYMKNICRGNTYLIEKHEDGSQKIQIIRRGMRKFLDLRHEFITIKDSKYLSIEHLKEKGVDLQSKVMQRKIILGPVLRAFDSKCRIRVTKMVKANGENAQISYSEEMDSWVICSKNVSLLAATKNDLLYFKPEGNNIRFSFAYLIGISWFDMISEMSAESIKELKLILKYNTFIGEYVGNQFHQHLIRYIEHTILFYSIVEKESDSICKSVELSVSIFKKFGLPIVPIEEIGIFDNYHDLCKALENLHDRIAESSIIDEEEGSVIYLSCLNTETEEEVISLCKLKTYEYKMYRKLREKLTNHLIRGIEDRFKINQFFDEVRQMLTGYELPWPMEFYYRVAETAFALIEHVPIDFLTSKTGEIELRGKYIDFLETVLSLVDSSCSLRTQAISELDIINTEQLINKGLISKTKTVEFYLYLPPMIETVGMLATSIERLFNIKIKKEMFSLEEHSFNEKIQVNILHFFNFKKIVKLKSRQFIVYLNPEVESKIIDLIVAEIEAKNLNPLFKTYNPDPTLDYFLKVSEKSLRDRVINYFEQMRQFVNGLAKHVSQSQMLCIENLFDDADKVLSFIKEKYLLTHEKIEGIGSEESCGIEERELKSLMIIDSNPTQNNKNSSVINQLVKANEKKTKSTLILLYNTYKNPFLAYKSLLNSNSDNKEQSDNKFSKKQLIVLIPMTIPGSGKTSFINPLKQLCIKKSIAFYTVGSDIIRRKCIDEIIHKAKNFDDAFQMTGKTSVYRLEEALRGVVDDFSTTKNKIALLYVDKNHPPNAISRTMDTINNHINSYYDEDISIKYIAMVADGTPFKLSEKTILSFSLEYFLQCYQRVRVRRDHPTLNGNKSDLMSIFGLFLSNFVNLEFGEGLLRHYKFSSVLKLPFTSETPKVVDNELKRLFTDYCFDTNSQSKAGVLQKAVDELVLSKKFNYDATYDKMVQITENALNEIVCAKEKNIHMKIPPKNKFLYLGIKLTESTSTITKFIGNCLNEISSFGNLFDDGHASAIIKSSANLKHGFNSWCFPKEEGVWHVTTYFASGIGQSERENNPAFKEFSEGKEINLLFDGFVYVVGNLMTAFSWSNDYYCNNKIAHMTCLYNGYLKPKHSNSVLAEALKHKLNQKVTYKQITIEGYKYDAYILCFKSKVSFKGEMTSFFQ